MNYASLSYAALFHATLPETALEIAALLVIVVDLGFLRKATFPIRTAFAAFIGVAGCIAAIWAVYASRSKSPHPTPLLSMLRGSMNGSRGSKAVRGIQDLAVYQSFGLCTAR